MRVIIKLCLPILVIFFLVGCATKTNNVIDIQPNIVLPAKDPSLKAITVTLSSRDLRQSNVLMSLNRQGQLVRFTPSRDLRFLMLEVLEKQMLARGYMVNKANNGVNVNIAINKLDIDAQEGDFRYAMKASANIAITVQAPNGATREKQYRATYSIRGALRITDDKITEVTNEMIDRIISEMANDNSLHNFIKQNA